METQYAHRDALAATGFPPATKMLQNTLSFTHPLPEVPTQALAAVDRMYHACHRCHLCSSRGRVVTWRGNPDSPVMFIGGSPNGSDDGLGTPFGGSDGTLQDELCKEFGLDPWAAFWTTMIGCRAARPWDPDREPTTAELVSCSERIFMILRAVRPRVIICLSKTATRLFFPEREPPHVWSYTQFVPPHDPDSWVMVGHAHHPTYLARVIGGSKTYQEFAAARSFYRILGGHVDRGMTKVPRWAFTPRYLADFVAAREGEPPWDTPQSVADTVAAPVLDMSQGR